MRNRPSLAIGLAVVAAVALVSTASAYHSWGTYHWARGANPFTLQVIDSVTTDWQFEFDTSLIEWSNPIGGHTDVLDFNVGAADDGGRTRKRCQSVSGQIRVCNATYGYTGWLGLASINIDSAGHILQGTAKVNDSYSYYWADPDEKRHVMCQEVGHLFGLGHTSEDGSSQNTCMDYSQSSTSISPNAHDFQELATIYAHSDSYDTFASGGSGGGGDGGGGGGCKGRGCNKGQDVPPMAVRVHQGPGFEIWVSPGANDSMWIHHVTLVPDIPHEH